VENFTSEEKNIDAINETAFEGGSSEEYQMFTQEDYNKLFEKLKERSF
jgi:hypothetical protein